MGESSLELLPVPKGEEGKKKQVEDDSVNFASFSLYLHSPLITLENSLS